APAGLVVRFREVRAKTRSPLFSPPGQAGQGTGVSLVLHHRAHVFWATGPESVRGMRISPRRFLAFPSGVLLLAIGAVSPLPSVWRRSGLAKRGLNKAATLFARSTDRW